jgi:hypothetical protein
MNPDACQATYFVTGESPALLRIVIIACWGSISLKASDIASNAVLTAGAADEKVAGHVR